MTFDTFTDDTWTNNSIAVLSIGTKPAFERGHYFDGAAGTLMGMSSFHLHLRFTVSGWVRVDNFDAERTFFSKDDNAGTPNVQLRAFFDTSGKMNVALPNPPTYDDLKIVTATNAVPPTDWKFVAFAVQLQADALTADVNLSINGTDDAKTSVSGYFWLDAAAAMNSYIGAYRTDTSVGTTNFVGFVYDFYVDHDYQTGNPTHFESDQANCGCGGDAC
jgi:hypothetical protein